MISELNFARRPVLPVIHQSEAAESGLACLAMVAHYYGDKSGLNGLRQRFPMSLRGATAEVVAAIAHQIELSARLIEFDLKDLRKLQTPAILELSGGGFVVLKRTTLRSVEVHDPAHGARQWTYATANEKLNGLALELAPSKRFTPQKTETRTRLRDLWSRMTGWKRAIGQLFALSGVTMLIAVLSPLYLQLAIDYAIVPGDESFLLVLALGFLGVHIIGAVTDLMRSWANLYFGNMMTFQVVGNLFRHLLKLPTSYYEKRHVGDILSRMQSTKPVQAALTNGIVSAVLDGSIAIVLAVILVIYSPLLATFCFFCTAVFIGTTAILFPRLRSRQEAEIAARAQEQSHLMESVKGAKLIKGAGMEAQREIAWRNLYAEAVNATVSTGKYNALMGFSKSLIGGVATVAVIYIAGRFAMDGLFTIGMIFSFSSYASQFASRANNFINQAVQFRMLNLHLSRIGDIVEQEEEEGLDAESDRPVEGRVSLTNVRFRYGHGDPWTLKDVSLEIAPGEFVAITGRSGGGKTTLLKLVLGLYPPSEGEIRIDDMPLPVLGKRAWRKAIGVVMQDDTLFSGSIANNIASFDPAIDMDRVREAATRARVHEDIMRQPSNYLTLVGDMGSTLSGGQRQRILLARALYREPSVLVLDEGTANLDLATERDIGDVVSAMPITRIVIAHRPELLRRADRILLMQDGELKEGASPSDEAVASGRLEII